MRKLKLDLDAVVVETFSTSFERAARGTVNGQSEFEPAASINLDGHECTRDGCSGDGTCSWGHNCSMEDCSGDCTGYPGCSDDGWCSEAYRCTGIGVCFWTP